MNTHPAILSYHARRSKPHALFSISALVAGLIAVLPPLAHAQVIYTTSTASNNNTGVAIPYTTAAMFGTTGVLATPQTVLSLGEWWGGTATTNPGSTQLGTQIGSQLIYTEGLSANAPDLSFKQDAVAGMGRVTFAINHPDAFWTWAHVTANTTSNRIAMTLTPTSCKSVQQSEQPSSSLIPITLPSSPQVPTLRER
jgi:hypothetical protein